mmetsp:Transcript_74589/g.231476  ORF Transcript_74589/g.231476 Transcript_74589/m.231476 type:complete len:308 (-) Transcript_74589:7-930(-)
MGASATQKVRRMTLWLSLATASRRHSAKSASSPSAARVSPCSAASRRATARRSLPRPRPIARAVRKASAASAPRPRASSASAKAKCACGQSGESRAALSASFSASACCCCCWACCGGGCPFCSACRASTMAEMSPAPSSMGASSPCSPAGASPFRPPRTCCSSIAELSETLMTLAANSPVPFIRHCSSPGCKCSLCRNDSTMPATTWLDCCSTGVAATVCSAASSGGGNVGLEDSAEKELNESLRPGACTVPEEPASGRCTSCAAAADAINIGRSICLGRRAPWQAVVAWCLMPATGLPQPGNLCDP